MGGCVGTENKGQEKGQEGTLNKNDQNRPQPTEPKHLNPEHKAAHPKEKVEPAITNAIPNA